MKNVQNSINQGLKVLVVFMVIFLCWAVFLPISSASIAEGLIIFDFNRKTIQHLEGGIVDQILVKEGQEVSEGDTLLYIRDVKVKSEQSTVQESLWTMQIQKERLLAEKENLSKMNLENFYSSLGEIPKDEKNKIHEIIRNQEKLFRTNRDKKHGEIKVLEKKLKSTEARLKIFREELSFIKPLVKEENLSILREFELQKSIADLEQESEATKLQITNYKNENLAQILKELKETDVEMTNLFNQNNVSKDALKRSAVISPVLGRVMNIKYHTIGAVVPPGGEIMNIVPNNEELIIEAKVKPQDIDNISIGMKAKVSLTAYKGKKVPKLNGEVFNVSPDIVINEQTRESYFLARVKIDKNDIEKLKNKVELYPGMPAQVFIITGSRSLVSYLFTPISESAYKAFKEE